jgi:1,4-dihydroxy-2-naphthoate octaprenyltransferase
MTSRQLLTYVAVTIGIAAAGGLYLILNSPNRGFAFAIFLAGLFFLLFYTWPLKYIGLGELAVILVWGPLMIGGGYYVITGEWSNNVVLAGLPYALGVTLVIFGKHIDKYSEDKKKGIHTLPVIIGEKASRYIAIAAAILQYLITTYLVIIGFFSPIMLLVWITVSGYPKLRAKVSLGQFINYFSKPRPKTEPKNWKQWPLYFVSIAFTQNERFGIVFVFALFLETIGKLIGII